MIDATILNQEALARLIRTETLAAIEEYFQSQPRTDGEPQDSRYMSRRELASYLSIGLSTVDHWVRIGRLRKIKIGRAVRFDRHEIDDSLDRLRKYARAY